MKICDRCFKEKEINDFGKNSHTKNGYLNQCKECVKKYVQIYKLNNPEKFKEIQKKYYWKNRDKRIKQAIKWGQDNKEKRDKYKKQWRETHKELTNHLAKNYQTRLKGAKGSHTLLEWQLLCQKFGNKCTHCKKRKKITKDHIIPISKGGSNLITNLQPLCINCNSKKSAKLVIKN